MTDGNACPQGARLRQSPGPDRVPARSSGAIASHYADGEASDQNNDAIKLDTDSEDGGSLTVYNYDGGLIEGLNGSGVNSNGTGTVHNWGTIIGTYDDAADFGDGDGVDIDHTGTIYNCGQILGEGSKGTKDGETEPSTSEAIAIGGGLIVNGDADTTDALISEANNGIPDDDSDNGDACAALTVVNYGTISGTEHAVAMGNGDDLFVYEDGSSVSGYVDAEGGDDTFELGETGGRFDLGLLGDGATYRNFEELTFAEGSAWTLTGASYFAGTLSFSDAELDLSEATLASADVEMTGGLLYGTGTVGNLTLGDGATIAPGHSICTFSVAGDLALGSDANYEAGIDAAGGSSGSVDSLVTNVAFTFPRAELFSHLGQPRLHAQRRGLRHLRDQPEYDRHGRGARCAVAGQWHLRPGGDAGCIRRRAGLQCALRRGPCQPEGCDDRGLALCPRHRPGAGR